MSIMSWIPIPRTEKKPIEEEDPSIETLLYSGDENPLANWSKFVKAGYIKRVEDEEVREKVLELIGPCDSVWITTPKDMGEKIGTCFDWLFFIIKPFPYKELSIELQITQLKDMDSNSKTK
ncbi:unnamed protein product [Nezara viridula]|uniref:CFA20 domain-containing protein n=1 Tax=Nezara viridula TaxID=85310 RepID=A0A9P0MPE3_NEZVI|nr:unnamed protein product [Nezara viridula]